MRKGNNPNKDKVLYDARFVHQVIIPVYIPNQQDYFKDAFKIFKKCIQSVLETISLEYTFITIINNGSCAEVENYLLVLKSEKKIQELINTSNIGKLNAIYKGVVGHNFDIITIADADTMFLPGWQYETIQIFNSFPKVGTVGIVPQFNMYANFCTNVIFDNFFNKKMRFLKVAEPKEMQLFYQSIGWDMKEDHYYLQYILGIEKSDVKACIGSSHFVATYRKEVLSEIEKYIPAKMGSDSERLLDVAAQNKDLWKLTTFKNYAYHMGNVYEDWMDEVKFHQTKKKLEYKRLQLTQPSKLAFLIKNKFFKTILRIKLINDFFFRYKGLSKNVLKQYNKTYY
ncbi:glycosyltransferase family A protein [Zunongwangia endophytica]|uniref:Glycosyltransferase family A protein n=1 Tax=Zunongwangia endophytica TaxID=1808945 RepID=A0ABV8H884_9FLAO|nr:glycosyltransferase family A protein [Zunongwangia endophytica]MDN3595036.1 glycosyltransferase family A protein [Zunongwangia endophytica]